MQYLIGVLTTLAFMTLWVWLMGQSNKKGSKWEAALMSHWDENNTLARRRAEALESIADTLDNSK